MGYLNNDCWCGTVKQFLALDRDTWLKKMEQRFHHVTPHKLVPQQKRAWANSFDVLHNALQELGEAYHKLHLVFEYCLPSYPPRANGTVSENYVIRADCVIVSETAAIVLEFKDRPDVRKEHGFSTRRYRNRLQKFHDQSQGKRKWAILIPTLSSGIREVILQRITACSPNRLAEELKHQLGEQPKPVSSIKAWCASAYSAHV